MRRNVLIVSSNAQYEQMFKARGWGITSLLHEADLVQFTGGSDVSPALYGEEAHPFTTFNSRRDEEESRVFNACLKLKKPMTGICRGGQFLNVMCGGSMYQHCNNHAIGHKHHIINKATGNLILATSTHHQMMRPSDEAEILATAAEATVVEKMVSGRVQYIDQKRGEDIESVYYAEQNVLCFQPHPEFMAVNSACQDFYFKLIKERLL